MGDGRCPGRTDTERDVSYYGTRQQTGAGGALKKGLETPSITSELH